MKERIKPKTSISELASYWRVQEGLLQGYRRLFLTLETILLSVGALTVSNKVEGTAQIIILISMLIIGAFSAYIFLPIIKTRGDVVFYWQAKILQAEKGIEIYQPLQDMKEFQKDKAHIFRTSEEFQSLSKGKHLTRNKLNVYLPIVILLAWVSIAIASFVK
jgi:uncharacterized membrane protein